MSGLVRTVLPSIEPVSLAEQMAHARLIDTNEGVLLEGYITAARIACENKVSQTFVTSTWRKQIDRWPNAWRLNPHAAVYLDRPPLQAVSAISYIKTDGNTTTLSTTAYTVNTDARPGFVTPAYNNTWPETQFVPNAITITYQAGYPGGSTVSESTSAAQVPIPAKTAIKILAQHYFQVRDTDVAEPRAVNELLSSIDHGSYRIPTPEDYL